MITLTAKCFQENRRNLDHVGRITLEGKPNTLSYKELIPHKNKKAFKLGCYPNFQIENGQILLDNPLPPDEISPNRQTKLMIKKLLPKRERAQEAEGIKSLQKYLEKQNLSCSGQILVLYLQKYNPRYPKMQINWNVFQGTCFILKFHQINQDYVVSAFHLINQEDETKYDIISFANFNEADLALKLETFVQVFLEEGQKYQTHSQRQLYFHNEFPKSTGQFGKRIIPIEISHVFLDLRKKFLETSDSHKYFLDPLFQIKSSPAADIVLFNADPVLIAKITNKPLEIASINRQDPGCIFVMFAAPKGLKIGSQEKLYVKTFEQDKELSNIMHHLEMIRFIHPNKSAGYGEIILHSELEKNPIIPFYGSATFGASGGPLLDREGRVVAMNFGNYYDVESDQDDSEEEDNEISSNRFDVKVEIGNKENLKKCKNFNLAISLQHPLLDLFTSEVSQNNKARLEMIETQDTKFQKLEEFKVEKGQKIKENYQKKIHEQKIEQEQKNQDLQEQKPTKEETEGQRMKKYKKHVNQRERRKKKRNELKREQEQNKQQERKNLEFFELNKSFIKQEAENEETQKLIYTQMEINQKIQTIIQQSHPKMKESLKRISTENVELQCLDQNHNFLKKKEENIKQNEIKKTQKQIKIKDESLENASLKKLKQ